MCAPVPVPRGTDLTASSCLFSAPLASLALVFLCLTFLIHLLHFSAAYVPGAEEQGPRAGVRPFAGEIHVAHAHADVCFSDVVPQPVLWLLL